MPVEIAVGPPVLGINQDATFMVTSLASERPPRDRHSGACPKGRRVLDAIERRPPRLP